MDVVLRILIIVCFTFSTLLNTYASHDEAVRLCTPKDKNSKYPALSFTLMSFHKGELSEKNCKKILLKGLNAGFTTVTFTPSFAVTQKSIDEEGKLHLFSDEKNKHSFKKGQLKTCLDTAWNYGFDIVYMPHLEDERTLESVCEAVWRASLNLNLDKNLQGNIYESVVFEEFIEWAKSHENEIILEERDVTVLVFNELESIFYYQPDHVLRIIKSIKEKLPTHTKIGVNTNWYPTVNQDNDNTLFQKKCKTFQDIFYTIDVVAPSSYGDWSEIANTKQKESGIEAVSNYQFDLVQLLINAFNDKGCDLEDENGRTVNLHQKAFAYGEFSISPNFTNTENDFTVADLFFPKQNGYDNTKNPLYMSHEELVENKFENKVKGFWVWIDQQTKIFSQKRQKAFTHLLNWGRTFTDEIIIEQPLQYLNLWNMGVWDPIGIYPIKERTVKDDKIKETFIAYSKERCNQDYPKHLADILKKEKKKEKDTRRPQNNQ